MTIKLTSFDASEYLKTEEDIASYLSVVLEDNDPVLLNVALGDIARARGMTDIARKAGVSRESLYRSLSEDGNPSATTLLKVISALGIQLHAAPRQRGRAIVDELCGVLAGYEPTQEELDADPRLERIWTRYRRSG